MVNYKTKNYSTIIKDVNYSTIIFIEKIIIINRTNTNTGYLIE